MNLLKKYSFFLLFTTFLFIISCNKNINNSNDAKKLSNESNTPKTTEIKWKDIKFNNDFNDLTYPQFYNLDKSIEKKINTHVENLIKEMKSTKDSSGLTYKVTYNKNNLISIRYFRSFQISNGSRLIYYQSQNFNTETGEILKLENFFNDGFNYSEIINNNISYYFKDNPDETYKNSVFEGIKEYEDLFYLTNEGFSFYFPPYKYKPNDASGPLDIIIDYDKFGINLKLIEIDSEEMIKKDTARKKFAEFLKSGKFQDSKFGIGDNINDIKNSLGTPESSGIFEGSNYYIYGNERYFCPLYPNKDEDKSKVTSITISKGTIFNTIKIGDSIKDIESSIGSIDKGYDEDGTWYAYCNFEDKIIVRFYSSDKNIVLTSELQFLN